MALDELAKIAKRYRISSLSMLKVEGKVMVHGHDRVVAVSMNPA